MQGLPAQPRTWIYTRSIIRIQSLGPPEISVTTVVTGIFLPFENIYPYFSLALPLSGGNILDELLHTVCAFPLHLLGYMTTNVQRKGCCRMAQVALNSLYIVSAFCCCHGIRVPLIRINRKTLALQG